MNNSENSILIICVSLLESLARRTEMVEQIQLLKNNLSDTFDISFEFFDAVNGKQLPKELLEFFEIKRAQDNLCQHKLGPSEIGCFFSHFLIWQKISRGDYDQYKRVIIIEDDVYLIQDNLIDKFHSIVNEQSYFSFLGGHSKPSRSRIRGFESKDHLYFNLAGPKDLYTATFAYTVSKKAASDFISKFLDRLSYIDDWKYLLTDIKLIPFYYIFDHDDEITSSIADDRKQFATKPNRFKKNFSKIKNDLFSRLFALILFKKIERLSMFISRVQTNRK